MKRPKSRLGLVLYVLAFAVVCTILLARVGPYGWDGTAALILQILTWGTANVAWYLVAFLALVFGFATANFSGGVAQAIAASILAFSGIALVQIAVLMLLMRLFRYLRAAARKSKAPH